MESKHFGSLLALNPDGSVALKLGSPDDQILPRSTWKPFQAFGVFKAGLELNSEQLAIAICSHGGSDKHLSVVWSLL